VTGSDGLDVTLERRIAGGNDPDAVVHSPLSHVHGPTAERPP
jgi:hypothetical protein